MNPRRLLIFALGWIVPVVVVLLAMQLWIYRGSSVPGIAPRPPDGIHELSNVQDLQSQFARDAGHARLVLLISPT
jgi:hypothetical protein